MAGLFRPLCTVIFVILHCLVYCYVCSRVLLFLLSCSVIFGFVFCYFCSRVLLFLRSCCVIFGFVLLLLGSCSVIFALVFCYFWVCVLLFLLSWSVIFGFVFCWHTFLFVQKVAFQNKFRFLQDRYRIYTEHISIF